MAAGRGNALMIRLLLDSAPSTVNRAKKRGLTALHGAAMVGSVDAVHVLLSAGADVVRGNAAPGAFTCPLAAAVIGGSDHVLRALLASVGSGISSVVISCALYYAVQRGRVSALKQILEVVRVRNFTWGQLRSAIPNNPRCHTHLHLAAAWGIPESVRFLLEWQANK